MTDRLDGTERDAALTDATARGWVKDSDRDAITKSYKFADFVAAFGFMTRAALHAEKLNHHPEWSNTYNRVEVTLTTHDCDGLSKLDFQLAEKMDNLAG